MRAAGLLVINPPFGFGQEMRTALGILAPLLGENADASARSRITILGDGSG
jgi:23S rRNA A2030 N6-methylase RlmJ